MNQKKGATWYRDMGRAIQVINLQGSQWSTIFFVNLGIYYKSFGAKAQPAEYECHIRTRLCQLVPDMHMLAELLDVHSKTYAEIDRSALPVIIQKYAFPWLDKCCTDSGVAEAIAEGQCLIHWSVKEQLNRDEYN